MKKSLVFLIVSAFLFTSCKKAIQQQEQNILVDIITSGNWIVEQYFEDTNNISSDFANYVFQFNKNGTVIGTDSVTVENGTWSGDINTKTIISNFPSAGDPLQKLNGTWTITDSYFDYVKAEKKTATGKNSLYLRKKT